MDGGADLLLIETIFDTLNAKAAIFAVETLFEERGRRWPVIISGTITDASGRTLSGQVTEAFWNSVRHARPLAVGLNCALGAARDAALPRRDLPDRGLVRVLLPQRRPAQRVRRVRRGARADRRRAREFADSGLVNIVGGCCGTTPAHIGAIAAAVEGAAGPGAVRARAGDAAVRPGAADHHRRESLFVNVGERTNITGSAQFRNLIKDGDYNAALTVARQQVENGAQVIDVNMDEGMIDGVAAMDRFIKLIASRARHLPGADDGRLLEVGGHRGRAASASRASRSSTRSR